MLAYGGEDVQGACMMAGRGSSMVLMSECYVCVGFRHRIKKKKKRKNTRCSVGQH